MKKIAVVCGGYSGESTVSLKSADMVMNNIDRSKYDAIKVIIDRKKWVAEIEGAEVSVDRNDFSVTHNGSRHYFDGAFIIIHGTPGEDGLLQGYFNMIGLPYTTGNVLNMSLTFNKKATTRALGQMGFTVAKSILLVKNEPYSLSFISQSLGLPCFVKPNCGGSSIGTSRVNKAEDLHLALDKAFKEDEQVIIEEFIRGTEVTCGVIIHHGKITALPITEIVSKKEFFDFEAKYQGASDEITPARLEPDMYQHIQNTSEDIYKKLDCRGMIRIDFLIRAKEVFVVEVNTVPGFTEASIIPQQALKMGINKTELITAVLESSF
ncbi:MAG: D-alanine--D-alanine ligase [Crocinitomicaceae bacterium]|nr:D-alanine--D-alanine ligase [Crocinitomicaceae bacterium]